MLPSFSRMLVVDDSAAARKIIRYYLHELGFFHVREAADGAAAWAMMKTQPFDVIVSDYEMEPVDGLALLRLMRGSRQWFGTPFLLITATAAHKFSAIIRDKGTTAYLAKPFSAAQFAERLAAFTPELVKSA